MALNTNLETATLQGWLDYISAISDKPIDLGLERMKQMVARMKIEFDCPVITVGGTNGKGSTCAIIDSVVRHAGHHTGLHTSPHLVRFNERCVIDGREVSDERIIEAFKEVEEKRGDLPLTYFEFTTLAILRIFQKADLDCVILEVGLGGRLDAVNAIDPTVSVVCSIDIDHAQYLGRTREEVGLEKACIFRHGRPAVCTDPNPPKSVLEKAHMLIAPLYVYGRDYDVYKHHGLWDFEMTTHDPIPSVVDWRNLPMPSVSGAKQLQNAAGALAALGSIRERLEITRSAVVEGLEHLELRARFETVRKADENGASVTLDVGHNPQAARVLAENIQQSAKPNQQVWAVFGMLKDKDMVEVSRTLARQFDRWFITGLPGVRGASVAELRQAMQKGGIELSRVTEFGSVDDALHAALDESAKLPVDTVRIIAFGSFVTVTAAIETMRHDVRAEKGD